MTTPVNMNAQQTSIVSAGSGRVTFGGVEMSLQEAVAMVFFQRSEVMGQVAADRAADAQGRLKEIQTAREMLARMKTLKKEAGGNVSTMPDDMVQWCKDNGIEFDHTANDNIHNKEEWDLNMQYAQNFEDKLTSNNDLAMIKLKSIVNKANEATQAADAMVTKNGQVSNSIISNMR